MPRLGSAGKWARGQKRYGDLIVDRDQQEEAVGDQSAEAVAKHDHPSGKLLAWVDRNDKAIGALSGVATAIGVLFAAASSYFAWQQIAVMNDEKLTPYRAIVYENKVDSYKLISDANMRFRHMLMDVRTIVDPETLSGGFTPAADAAARVARREASVARLRDFDERFDEYKRTLAVNSAFWPRPVSDRIASLASVVKDAARCPEALKDKMRFESVLLCSRDEVSRTIQAFDLAARNLEISMHGDLRSDQMQITSEP
jgi:hypothetical protein